MTCCLQLSAHCPQRTQSASSRSFFFTLSWTLMLIGQLDVQVPQAMHFSGLALRPSDGQLKALRVLRPIIMKGAIQQA